MARRWAFVAAVLAAALADEARPAPPPEPAPLTPEQIAAREAAAAEKRRKKAQAMRRMKWELEAERRRNAANRDPLTPLERAADAARTKYRLSEWRSCPLVL